MMSILYETWIFARRPFDATITATSIISHMSGSTIDLQLKLCTYVEYGGLLMPILFSTWIITRRLHAITVATSVVTRISESTICLKLKLCIWEAHAHRCS